MGWVAACSCTLRHTHAPCPLPSHALVGGLVRNMRWTGLGGDCAYCMDMGSIPVAVTDLSLTPQQWASRFGATGRPVLVNLTGFGHHGNHGGKEGLAIEWEDLGRVVRDISPSSDFSGRMWNSLHNVQAASRGSGAGAGAGAGADEAAAQRFQDKANAGLKEFFQTANPHPQYSWYATVVVSISLPPALA